MLPSCTTQVKALKFSWHCCTWSNIDHKNPADVTTTSPKRTVRSGLSENSVICSARAHPQLVSQSSVRFSHMAWFVAFPPNDSKTNLSLCTLNRFSVSWMKDETTISCNSSMIYRLLCIFLKCSWYVPSASWGSPGSSYKNILLQIQIISNWLHN